MRYVLPASVFERYVSAASVFERYVVDASVFERYLLSAYPTLTICLSPPVPASVTASPLISPFTVILFANVLLAAVNSFGSAFFAY